jgi:hypothetical protein
MEIEVVFFPCVCESNAEGTIHEISRNLNEITRTNLLLFRAGSWIGCLVLLFSAACWGSRELLRIKVQRPKTKPKSKMYLASLSDHKKYSIDRMTAAMYKCQGQST